MASTLAAPKSHNLPHFIGKNYEVSLNQSIEALLTSIRNSNPGNSTSCTSEFQEFVQSKVDPPLESIWVYTALTFTSSSTPKTDSFSRILAIKDLFQLIVSCSASCSSVKSIALAAPVIYYLHGFILDVKGFQLGPKKDKKLNGETKTLVDSILGYINVCCNGFDGNFDDLEDLIRPLGDLISFWLMDDGAQDKNVESLRVFFPLLSDSIVKRISIEGCGIVDLAGFVVAEVFLLKLCWKIREEGFGEKMQNELKSWIVGSITALRSSYFYVTLVSMLFEQVLPVTSLVNLEHQDGLREVLFDALIVVEYSFLSPGSLGQLPVKDCGDHTKAISYLNAFANSSLPSLIVKWVRTEIGNESGTNAPTGSSPRAFLKWMLNIENKGIKLFDDDMSNFRAAFNSKEEADASMEEDQKPDSNLLFYIDNKGQKEYENEDSIQMNESMSAAFRAAAHSMHSPEQGGRKRKTKKCENTKQVKFVKYNALKHSSLSGERSADPRNDHSDSGSDVENPSSDEDMGI
ncbi:UNVERIFIED_CONTAM: hypothetical protein Slati_2867200 [Sesamum latifolium]|uniref:Uncharacterized protein n=1 Tax=Sesamum latifolium TaxID=2727402 RepID=A0AAW2VAY7_9LAMI